MDVSHDLPHDMCFAGAGGHGICVVCNMGFESVSIQLPLYRALPRMLLLLLYTTDENQQTGARVPGFLPTATEGCERVHVCARANPNKKRATNDSAWENSAPLLQCALSRPSPHQWRTPRTHTPKLSPTARTNTPRDVHSLTTSSADHVEASD